MLRPAALVALALAAPVHAALDLDALTLRQRAAVNGQGVAAPLPGSVVVVHKDGDLVYRQAFGTFTPARVSPVASISKTYSAALVSALADSGALALDDALGTRLNTFTGAKAAITVRQAFSHTSGLGENYPAVFSQTLDLRESARLSGNAPLLGAPGTRFDYGETAMQAAGGFAEIAAGADARWSTLFQQRIAGPLGMASTDYLAGSNPNNPLIGSGARTSADDMARFMEMLRRGGAAPDGTQVLSANAVNQMLTRQVPANAIVVDTPVPPATYGLGTWLDVDPATGAPRNAFGAGLFGSFMNLNFADGTTVAFLTESNNANVTPLIYAMLADLEASVDDPALPGDADRDDAVDFADLATLAANYNGVAKLWAEGDFTGDGAVGFADLSALAANYGGGAARFEADWARALASVPEPGAGLAAAGALAPVCAARRRHRRA